MTFSGMLSMHVVHIHKNIYVIVIICLSKFAASIFFKS